ncbi:hypothetical protein [Pseudomonas batumici]|uniref:hypothetical protein n=1 Tax=Pseudomonas batumici TaxID=226910 RepID=UPI00058A4270|nr:hypothetical protein [Pseudomonas batumici]
MNTDAAVSNSALILLEGRSDISSLGDLPTHKVPASDLVTVVTLRDVTHPDQPVTLDTSRQKGALFSIKYALCQRQARGRYELFCRVYSGDTITDEGHHPVTLGDQDQRGIVVRVEPRTSPPPVAITQLVMLEGTADWTTRELRDPNRLTEVKLLDITDPAQPIIMDVSKKTGSEFEIKYAHCQVRPGHVYRLSGQTYQQGQITHIGSMGITLDGNGHKGLSIELTKLEPIGFIDRDPT